LDKKYAFEPLYVWVNPKFLKDFHLPMD
jgi:hypothetical protein